MTAGTIRTRIQAPLRIFRELLSHSDYSHIDDEYFQEFHSYQSPLNIPDLEKAVKFLKTAMDQRQFISVLGDRDVDGVASTAMMGSFLKEHHEKNGGRLAIRVSDSGDDYGITGSLFSDLLDLRADLYIFLDMGSSHRDAVAKLLETGAVVIILDHHQIPDEGPVFDRCAFVNPVRNPDLTKFATVMVAMKFLSALALSHTKEWNTAYLIDVKPENCEGLPSPLYRCGQFLGEFSSPDDADFFIQKNFPDFTSVRISEMQRENRFLGDEDIRAVYDDVARGGRFVLGARVKTMPRLSRFMHSLSDLLALGTIADMMPLLGENRMFARIGMGFAGIGNSRVPLYRPGYRALLKSLQIKDSKITSRDVGWGIAPALNAAGRMGETKLSLDLLLEEDAKKGTDCARSLIRLNEDRKRRTSRNEEIVNGLLDRHPEKLNYPFIFCYHPDLEPGVSGIVATRLTERFQKPVIYLNPDGPHARGSARTWGGINVLDFISRASEHFIQFGGHPEACGFSLSYESIQALEACLIENSSDLPLLESLQTETAAHIDLSPMQLTWNAQSELELFEPFGSGNPEPVIQISSAEISEFGLLAGIHAKFKIRDAPDYLECIFWKQGSQMQYLWENGIRFNMTGALEKSSFGGKISLRFRVDCVKQI